MNKLKQIAKDIYENEKIITGVNFFLNNLNTLRNIEKTAKKIEQFPRLEASTGPIGLSRSSSNATLFKPSSSNATLFKPEERSRSSSNATLFKPQERSRSSSNATLFRPQEEVGDVFELTSNNNIIFD
jgi:hypothetical protein